VAGDGAAFRHRCGTHVRAPPSCAQRLAMGDDTETLCLFLFTERFLTLNSDVMCLGIFSNDSDGSDIVKCGSMQFSPL
jgi:hypothetical protein